MTTAERGRMTNTQIYGLLCGPRLPDGELKGVMETAIRQGWSVSEICLMTELPSRTVLDILNV